jgi:hypothetical protein
MTDATRQQRPEGRATQSRPGFASASGSAFRRCPRIGAGLRHFAAPSLPLPRTCSATERADRSQRSQVGVYRQTSSQPDSAGPRLCGNQTIVHQRGGQPGIARAATARARAWVSRNQIVHAPVVWNIDSIVCCRKNWRKSTSCWSRRTGGQWRETRKRRRTRRNPVRR